MTFKYCNCDRLFFRIPQGATHDEHGYHWDCPTCGAHMHREEGVIEPSLIRTVTWAIPVIFFYYML
jgi:hypothetical protein